MKNEQVFYSAAKYRVIDGVRADGRGHYSGETLEQMRARYPDVEIIGVDTAIERLDAAFRSAPAEVTEERFWEMLDVLPPLDWRGSDGAESFKLSEFTSGTITAIFCRIGTRYFELSDNVSTPHEEIVRRCREAIAQATGKTTP